MVRRNADLLHVAHGLKVRFWICCDGIFRYIVKCLDLDGDIATRTVV